MSPFHALFGFEGRMRRRDFWWYSAGCYVTSIGLIAMAGLIMPLLIPVSPGHGRALSLIVVLPFFGWTWAALMTKRFHDRNRQMFDILSTLAPVRGWIWGLSECCAEGTAGDNAFGPPPKPVPTVADVF